MNDLQRLVDGLTETGRAAARLELAAIQDPDNEILRINARSVAKRRADLIRRLDATLNTTQSELVRYRIKRGSDRYPAKAVAAVISAFQELVTAVFDALHTGQAKQRYRPAADSVELSTFEFAGAGPGSVIISLSALNDRLLFGGTELDQTFALIERALSARESEDLQLLADRIGVAAITKAYAWADASVSYGIDTTIKWGKSYDDYREILITNDDAIIIKSLIENKSESNTIKVDADGILHGFDGSAPYFHFETYGERLDLRGDVDPALSKSWTVGKPYHATLLKKVRLKYATGQEEISWTLVALELLAP